MPSAASLCSLYLPLLLSDDGVHLEGDVVEKVHFFEELVVAFKLKGSRVGPFSHEQTAPFFKQDALFRQQQNVCS